METIAAESPDRHASLPTKEAALDRARQEALAKLVVPPGCEIEFVPTVPYSGNEPLVQAIVRQPIDPRYASLPA